MVECPRSAFGATPYDDKRFVPNHVTITHIAAPIPGEAASITIFPDGNIVLRNWDFGEHPTSDLIESAIEAVRHRAWELRTGFSLKNAKYENNRGGSL